MAKNLAKRSEDYSAWYNGIIKQAGLAEVSAVRGCMIIKPYGFAIWEKMKSVLDQMFKDTGHQNAYFPIFIPKSFFSKEASHVEGFAKECAIVTHYKLRTNPKTRNIEVDPDARLEEELIVRPTSETIIWDSYRRWIQSYRDLPILLNQWCNVVRWEMRTRMFLRTAEILWQEGHTAHATKNEALEESQKMLNVYSDFIENHMAVPIIKGRKTENEKFAGADITYTVETLTQDNRALQAGTSHFLGTNFAKAFDVKFANKNGQLEYVWGASWGLTTRLIGALIMCHSDDDGLVLPPKLAPIQVVIIPVYKSQEEFDEVSKVVLEIMHKLQKRSILAKFDDRDNYKPGWKFAEYEMKGVPIRVTIGPRDIKNNSVEIKRRDTSEKTFIKINEIDTEVNKLLEDIQTHIFEKAIVFRKKNTTFVDTYEEFKETLKNKRGFIMAHWDGTKETELKIKEETKATIRCIPLEADSRSGKCIYSGKESKRRVLFAEAY